MAESSTPAIITAIADSDFEGIVSSNLHSQGWDIIARAVDFDSLLYFVNANSLLTKSAILIYAPDLPGFTSEKIREIQPQFQQVIGYGSEVDSKNDINLTPRPIDTTELLSQIRGIMRREFREPLIARSRVKNLAGAKVIAIGSAGTSTGATTLTINLAMESSLLNKRTLVIDANSFEPAIAIALELRNLRNELNPRLISPMLWAYEITESKSASFLEFISGAYSSFDLILIDLGSISNLAAKLTDRRWSSQILIWSCDNADEIWINSRPDQIGRFRLSRLLQDLAKSKIKAELQFIANLEVANRRKDQIGQEIREEIEHLTTNQSNPIKYRSLPRDSRAVSFAAASSAALSESKPKSALRKAISQIASEI